MERKREEKMEGKGVFSEEYILTPPQTLKFARTASPC